MIWGMSETGRGKSYSDAQNELIRAAARRLTEREGSATAAAKLLGVSQPTLSNFLNGRTGAGVQLAQAIARALSLTTDELLGEPTRIGLDTRPVFSSLPGWHEALLGAQRKATWLPPRAWEYAAQQNALFMLSVTEKDVLETALFWMARASEHEQDEASRERIDATEADREARQIEAERRIAEMLARGEKPPSKARLMHTIKLEREAAAEAEAKAKDAARLRDAPGAEPANDRSEAPPATKKTRRK